jgi:2-oxoglutarate ferredoxin oxidoreductase subunit delta
MARAFPAACQSIESLLQGLQVRQNKQKISCRAAKRVQFDQGVWRMAYQYEIESERCKGCGLCVSVCPKKVLELSGEVNSKGYFSAFQARPEDCIVCALCCTMCPDVAITITEIADATAP